MTVSCPVARDPSGLRPRSRLRSSPGLAFCLALALEILAVGGLLRWRQDPPADPVPIAVMQVAHVALPAPVEEPRPEPPAARPDSPPPSARPAAPPKRGQAASRPLAAPSSPAAAPAVRGETVAMSPPAMASPDAPPAEAAPADGGASTRDQSIPATAQREAETGFEILLRAAVQDAARFPAAARAMGRQGRVRVGFDFRDGEVSSVRIVQSAGFDSFDEAAVGAVTRAAYPSPPDHLKGRTLHLTVWVEFLKKGD